MRQETAVTGWVRRAKAEDSNSRPGIEPRPQFGNRFSLDERSVGIKNDDVAFVYFDGLAGGKDCVGRALLLVLDKCRAVWSE